MLRSILLMSRPPLLCEEGNVPPGVCASALVPKVNRNFYVNSKAHLDMNAPSHRVVPLHRERLNALVSLMRFWENNCWTQSFVSTPSLFTTCDRARKTRRFYEHPREWHRRCSEAAANLFCVAHLRLVRGIFGGGTRDENEKAESSADAVLGAGFCF